MKVGTFVTIQGKRNRFFGVVTDVSLRSTDPTLVTSPPDVSDAYVASVMAGTMAYGSIKVEPMLIQDIERPLPAKTVPDHFSLAMNASDRDIEVVFGKESENNFWIGTPLDMESKLCLSIPRLIERSNGIFGKSGTGKTFLTRLLLIGILQSGNAVNLVFDMHGEYGWDGSSEGRSRVKGLNNLKFILKKESNINKKIKMPENLYKKISLNKKVNYKIENKFSNLYKIAASFIGFVSLSWFFITPNTTLLSQNTSDYLNLLIILLLIMIIFLLIRKK